MEVENRHNNPAPHPPDGLISWYERAFSTAAPRYLEEICIQKKRSFSYPSAHRARPLSTGLCVGQRPLVFSMIRACQLMSPYPFSCLRPRSSGSNPRDVEGSSETVIFSICGPRPNTHHGGGSRETVIFSICASRPNTRQAGGSREMVIFSICASRPKT